MHRVISSTEARERFDELMQQVADGQQTIAVARHDQPEVVIISMAEYERLRTDADAAEDWLAQVDHVREQIGREVKGRSLPDITALIHEMREERDGELLANLHRR